MTKTMTKTMSETKTMTLTKTMTKTVTKTMTMTVTVTVQWCDRVGNRRRMTRTCHSQKAALHSIPSSNLATTSPPILWTMMRKLAKTKTKTKTKTLNTIL